MKNWLSTQWQENKGLLIFILLMFIFRSAVADWNDVPTGSMKPTILEGDRILVNKLAYDVSIPFTGISINKLSDPKRGDIIVFDSEVSGKRLVKRVVGVPGDSVSMINNQLFLNGEAVQYSDFDMVGQFKEAVEFLPNQEHKIRLGEGIGHIKSFKPVRVPAGKYLAMGDNRDNSADSRMIGFIPRDEIIGQANYVVLSLDYDNFFLPRSNRFLAKL